MTDLIQEIYGTIMRNKLRTALTGFSVAWGIFMLIVLLGAGNGLLNAIMQNSGQFLDNSMMVFGGYTSKPYDGLKEGRRIELNDNDITATGNNFSGNVETTGAEISQSGVRIAFGDEYVSGNSLCGTYPNKADINKISMLYGRFVNMTDIHERRKIIVLSEGQAKELAPHDISSLIGKTVDVGGLAFRVAGIYKDDNSRMNTDAYTAFTTLRAIYSRGDKADRIFFTFTGLNTMDENEKFESAYRAGINRNHRAAPDDEEAVWLWNRFTQNLQMNQGTDIIRTALWIIGLSPAVGRRGSVQHHAHNSEGAHTRVRHTQGDRSEPVVHSAADHNRKHHHNNLLRIHRNGSRHSREHVYGRHHRQPAGGHRTVPGGDVRRPHRGTGRMHTGYARDDSGGNGRRIRPGTPRGAHQTHRGVAGRVTLTCAEGIVKT